MYVLPTGPAATRSQADTIPRTPEERTFTRAGHSPKSRPPLLCASDGHSGSQSQAAVPQEASGGGRSSSGASNLPVCFPHSSLERGHAACVERGASVGKRNTVLLQHTQPPPSRSPPCSPHTHSPQNRTHGHRVPPGHYLELYHFVLRAPITVTQAGEDNAWL